jgi:hypothetical protein
MSAQSVSLSWRKSEQATKLRASFLARRILFQPRGLNQQVAVCFLVRELEVEAKPKKAWRNRHWLRSETLCADPLAVGELLSVHFSNRGGQLSAWV